MKSNRNVIDWNVIVIDANVIVIDWKVIDFFYYFFYYFLSHWRNLYEWQIPTNILTSVHSKWISLNILSYTVKNISVFYLSLLGCHYKK